MKWHSGQYKDAQPLNNPRTPFRFRDSGRKRFPVSQRHWELISPLLPIQKAEAKSICTDSRTYTGKPQGVG